MSSLRPDDRSGRSGRSRSRTGDRDRDRSRSNVREATKDSRSKKGSKSSGKSSREKDEPIVMPGGFEDESDKDSDDNDNVRRPKYEVRTPGLSSVGLSQLGRPSSDEEEDDDYDEDLAFPAPAPMSKKSTGRKTSGSEVRRSIATMPNMPNIPSMNTRFAPPPSGSRYPNSDYDFISSPSSYSTPYPEAGAGMPSFPTGTYGGPAAIPTMPMFPTMPNMPAYAPPAAFQHGRLPDHQYADLHMDNLIRSPSNPASQQTKRPSASHSQSEQAVSSRTKRTESITKLESKGRREHASSISSPYGTEVREAKPSVNEEDHQKSSLRGRGLSVNDNRTELRAPSPGGLGSRMNRLSVSGNRPDIASLGPLPPGSPLLEAYKGTYQSISPMPSPMMLPRDDESDLDDLPPLSPSNTDLEKKEIVKAKKKVKLYDAEGDAEKIAKALKHGEPRREPLTEVLPELTHDQMLALRDEYKKLVKVSGKGVNLSKHINMKFSTRDKFGQACYVTSLGRWESEAYWANFWYQEHSSNRELLIEALMGRSNADIREIKASFKAKKYDDDLSRCLEKELKPDKFRTAILLALEGRRHEETDALPVDYRNRDVQQLYDALNSRQGGETIMIQIIVSSSDNHLREVLKTYERMHQVNFAREALRKSTNLVGEVIAHILNGVINRPARDCLLLRHAINDLASHNHEVKNRYELLMSRLIRLHWDRLHLMRVKQEYRSKYRADIESDIEAATKGDFGEFCIRLCET